MLSWSALFGEVLSVLKNLESKKDLDHERATVALNALSDAFFSTSAYYESVFSSDAQKREAQFELAKKWDHAANLIRVFDTNLWTRFNLKSRFWYDGEAWTDEQVASANIGLSRVRNDARYVLLSKQRAANK